VTEKKSSQPSEATLFTYFNEVSIIAQLIIAQFERSLPDGLTNSQFSVLNWFSRVDSPASPSRLATAFQVTPGAMTNTLKKLESKGLVKIEPDELSGRKKKVSITSRGEKLQKQALNAAAPLFQEIAKNCPLENIEIQVAQLQRVREYLDRRRYN
jgi:DNA-binding MarR family transcriptional regulator